MPQPQYIGGDPTGGLPYICVFPTHHYTYTSTEGCLKDCSLSIEMMHPDSTYQMNIETFSIIWKPMEIAALCYFEK